MSEKSKCQSRYIFWYCYNKDWLVFCVNIRFLKQNNFKHDNFSRGADILSTCIMLSGETVFWMWCIHMPCLFGGTRVLGLAGLLRTRNQD